MESRLPTGLRFFATDTPAAYRRTRIMFVCVMILISFSIGWPIYPLFSKATPFIFGLPLSFAWIIACLFLSLIALVALYRNDTHQKEQDSMNQVEEG